ncbi:MAG: UDP-N-acetylglucosamine--N-acetylmuramyl-(pentapeptide) pyrophosphoryl-undecaprenol N-acetylglucosamine transferase [bacterium]
MFGRNKPARILLTGGGTVGSVTPLLAIKDSLQQVGLPYTYYWVGTKFGPERQMIMREGLPYKAIDSGKLRRYWSQDNFQDIPKILKAFGQAFKILVLHRPQLIITAGSFVSVPLVIVGKLLGIPSLIHQLDYQPGLANKIMAKFAKKITVTFVKSLKDYGDKAEWVGSLLRKQFLYPLEEQEAKDFFGLHNDLPVLLVLGGGTGAKQINDLITTGLADLTRFCQIIHITGHNKETNMEAPNYYSFNFLYEEDMAKAYLAADLVVSRAGMGILTELSFLAKPTILIPMPDSHQELNAKAIQGGKAAIVLDEKKLTAPELSDIIQEIIYSHKLLDQMSSNIQKAFKVGNKRLVEIVSHLVK